VILTGGGILKKASREAGRRAGDPKPSGAKNVGLNKTSDNEGNPKREVKKDLFPTERHLLPRGGLPRANPQRRSMQALAGFLRKGVLRPFPSVGVTFGSKKRYLGRLASLACLARILHLEIPLEGIIGSQ